ncbi:MAG TPA: SDR family NAD(P)-dependent oxidoreductase [Niallia sp.]|nr:SDR family NAD(P)-dependent oxidoreductase [Niallia sp.]
MEKVLVTGGAGFIGSHIVDKLLEEGYKVAVVDNLSTGKIGNFQNDKVKFYEVDITDEVALIETVTEFQPKYIIHQAAQVSVAESVKDMLKDEQINIRGSLNVIEAARLNNVRKIVFASSAAVYGEPQYLPIDENHPINPMSPYGLSKYTVEKYLQLAHDLYDIDYTIFRYSNVYGPRQDAKGEGGVVAIFGDLLVEGKVPVIYGDGEQTRDFIYVEDVARANVKALLEGGHNVYNISSAYKTSVNELIYIFLEKMNIEIQPIYTEERNGDIKDSLLANKKAISSLNWMPTYKLNSGIDKVLDFYKNNISWSK